MSGEALTRIKNPKAWQPNHNVDFSHFFDKRKIIFRRSAGSSSKVDEGADDQKLHKGDDLQKMIGASSNKMKVAHFLDEKFKGSKSKIYLDMELVAKKVRRNTLSLTDE